jgi:putative DNA primase/helicase
MWARFGAFKVRGASRFDDMHATADQRTSNWAGFYLNGRNGKRTFMVLPKAFRREVSNGFDAKALMQALLACG